MVNLGQLYEFAFSNKCSRAVFDSIKSKLAFSFNDELEEIIWAYLMFLEEKLDD